MSGKRYSQAAQLADREHEHSPVEAIKALKAFPDAKFDETVEIAFRLGVDPRKADQLVRGTVSLPNGSGKSVRVAVFAQGPKATEANEAGADVVGGEELVEQVIGGIDRKKPSGLRKLLQVLRGVLAMSGSQPDARLTRTTPPSLD